MKDFALDPQSNTFLRSGVGLRYTLDRAEYLAQKIRCTLSMFLGEWYLNITLGIPYLHATESKGTNRMYLESTIKAKIVSVSGIKKLLSFIPVYDGVGRVLSISFIAQADDGTVIEGNT